MHSSYKKRKEKKLNMQGKDNMVLDYFIINIHMQLRRRGGLVTILPIPRAYKGIHAQKEREVVAHEQGILGFFGFILTYIYTYMHSRSGRGRPNHKARNFCGHMH